MSDTLSLYNTTSKSLETFTPIDPHTVGVYSCGPTVYHYQHLGNMRAAVFADTLHRTLVSLGYHVKHVINITDVGHLTSDGDTGEDKLEKGARREGKTAWEVARFYTDAYFKDLARLGIVLDEYLFPRATDHIKEQIALIRSLEEKGYTYVISDGVYFDTSKFPRYGDFAHLDIEGLKSGARIEENTEKKHITDFALWKFSPSDAIRDMEWESPWGTGFPGWHVECSAMSMKYLGEQFDIHTGGIDHIPVHHTNEIAQSECATGHTYVNYWLHNNFLNDALGKMAKSNDDFLRLQILIDKGYNPHAFRYLLLTTHYRKELQFSFESLDAATVAYNKLVEFCRHEATKTGTINQRYLQAFKDAMYDDLNTPQALAVVWTMLKDIDVSKADMYATLLACDSVLGLGLAGIYKEEIVMSDEMQSLLRARDIARKEKNFNESDRLRAELEKEGYTVKDTPEGQRLEKRFQV
ncbi:MAG: Cysteine--tRNA ligase [Candidatus Parcubacteria bacterium]|jgi:cysteinyl-tRNA synthetase